MWNVIPIFATPLLHTYIDSDVSGKLKKVCGRMDWHEDSDDTGERGGASKNLYVLHDMDKSVLKYFEKLFNQSIQNVLGYENPIQITTSWFTKTYPGGSCAEHTHTNSWYSAVIYFDEYDDNSSQLKLMQFTEGISSNSAELNIYNSSEYKVVPQQNLMVMFPSGLRHKVTRNNSDKIRYSLAINMMPRGLCGTGDSVHHY